VKKPFVTVDLSEFAEHKLPQVFVSDKARDQFINKLPSEELVVNVMLIGREHKRFKEWFAENAEFVWELPDRLPERGPNAIEIRTGEETKIYTWSEFCVESFGVSDHWVRKQLCLYRGMKDKPEDFITEPAPKPEPKDAAGDKADEVKVSKLKLETLEHKAQTYESRYSQTVSELLSLLKVIEEIGDKVPMKLIAYVRDLEKRLALLNPSVEPEAAGSKFVVTEEPGELKSKAAKP
jgi:hypothetical protein